MKISRCSHEEALDAFEKHSAFRGPFDLAIAARDEHETLHGVIALRVGEECSMAHLYTDANAQVGSLLYGAACRVAKALGYRYIVL